MLDGGAKQALHYTVTPLVMLAVTEGRVFGYVVGPNGKGLPEIKIDALEEAWESLIRYTRCVRRLGKSYLDAERVRLEEFAAKSIAHSLATRERHSRLL